MHALPLLLVLAATPDWSMSAPATLPASAAPCPCGGNCPPGACPCKGGECLNGAGTVSPAKTDSRLTVGPPHLTATVADAHCPPCEKWEAEELPRLLAQNWRVEVKRVPFGSVTTPSFRLRDGRELIGYTGVASFEAWLGGGSVGVKPAAVTMVLDRPLAVAGTPSPRVSNPPARRTWHMSGGESPASLAAHLRSSHGINPPPGASYAELVRLHSHAHEGTLGRTGYGRAVSAVPRYVAPRYVVRSSCPSGRCPGR